MLIFGGVTRSLRVQLNLCGEIPWLARISFQLLTKSYNFGAMPSRPVVIALIKPNQEEPACDTNITRYETNPAVASFYMHNKHLWHLYPGE